MNKLTNFISLVIFILIISGSTFGQVKDYQYKRHFKAANNEWQQLTLPDEIYSKLNNELSDLRIIKISGSDTIEVPYIPSFRFNTQEQNEQYFTLINKTRSDEGFYYTYKVPSTRTLNKVRIKTDLTNFDWRVNLEGSNDNLEWFTITGNYRVTGFSNNETSFSYTEIKFSDCEFRYYRLLIKTKVDPEISNVGFVLDEKSVNDNGSYEAVTFTADNDRQRKQTVINILLPMKVPISHVAAKLSTDGFYFRPFTLEYLIDTVRSPKGWVEQYSYSISGVLDSRTGNNFYMPEVITNKLRIVIDNSDNQPLIFSSFEIKRINHWLLFRISAEGSYILVYGNKAAGIPHYDIAKNYEDGAPLPEAKAIAVGNEEKIIKADTSAKSFLDEKILLYSVMGVGLLLLGFYLFRMLKKVN